MRATRSTCWSTCTRSTSTRARRWPRSARATGTSRRQVGGWIRRASATRRTDDIGDWSRRSWPGSTSTSPTTSRSCLIHNDFRFDNLVLAPRRPDAGRRRPRLGDGHRRRPADGPRRHAGLLGAGRRRRVLPAVPAPADRPRRACGPAREVVEPLLRADGLRRDARAVAVLRGVRAVPARRHRPADLLPLLPRADHQRGVRRLRPGRAATSSSAAARSLDRTPDGPGPAGPARPGVVGRRRLRRALETGWEQCRLLGTALAARGVVPDVRRARRHAPAPRDRRGRAVERGRLATPVEVDDGLGRVRPRRRCWRAHPAAVRGRASPTRREFQALVRGGHRRAGPAASTTTTTPSRSPPSPTRVEAALRRAADAARRRRHRASSSPAAARSRWAAAAPARRRRRAARLWRRLNPVSSTPASPGWSSARRGTTLVSFNEHAHLDARPTSTYR